MHFIFVRHGPKEQLDGVADADLALAATAAESAHRLKMALAERQLVPHVIVSSRYRHALETAQLLRGERTRAVIPVTALTPHTAEKDFSMATIVSEALAAGVDLFDWDVIMLVGHETRLSQLTRLVAKQASMPELAPLEARIVELQSAEVARFKP